MQRAYGLRTLAEDRCHLDRGKPAETKFDDLPLLSRPNASRLAEMKGSVPQGSIAGGVSPDKPFVASMGIYVFSRDVLMEIVPNENGLDPSRIPSL